MAQIGKDIDNAAQLIMNGDIVAIPTETVYGLAANALNVEAVSKIFAVKERPNSNPLILHLPSRDAITPYVSDVPTSLERLMQIFWPGSLTVLLPKSALVPAEVNAGLPLVALRVPDHALTLELLRQIKVPLAAPSANPFGYISPTEAQHVEDQLGKKITYILDGGICSSGLESTIIGMEGEDLVVYRLGAIAIEDIAHEFSGVVRLQNIASDNPLSPGMLPYHYSPKTPLCILDNVKDMDKGFDIKRVGIISYSWDISSLDAAHTFTFRVDDFFKYAGRDLYRAMHKLDHQDLDMIIVERFPNKGLGPTINDRLERAAKKRMVN